MRGVKMESRCLESLGSQHVWSRYEWSQYVWSQYGVKIPGVDMSGFNVSGFNVSGVKLRTICGATAMGLQLYQTLNRKCTMSPSFIEYSLPSSLIVPFSFATFSEPAVT